MAFKKIVEKIQPSDRCLGAERAIHLCVTMPGPKSMLCLASLFLLSSLFFSLSSATVYYVSTSGSAAASGLTEGAAWSLSHAAASALAGDTVNIKAGLYLFAGAGATLFRLARSGTATQRIVFRGYRQTPGDLSFSHSYGQAVDPSAMPVIRQSDRANSRGEGTVFLISGDYVTLENVLVQHFSTAVTWQQTAEYGIMRNLVTVDQGDLGRSTYSGSAVITEGHHLSISDCFSVNGGDQQWTIRSKYSTYDNIHIYADNAVNPPDYYFLLGSIAGGDNTRNAEYNVATRIHVERVGDLSHGGHGIVFKGQLPVRHNIVQDWTIVNTILEIQFPQTSNNTCRGGTVTFPAGSTNKRGAVFANGAHENVIEDIKLLRCHIGFRDWNDGAPGDGPGQGRDNVVNRVSVESSNACVAFDDGNLGTSATNNRFYNLLCNDIDYLVHNRGANSGTIIRNGIFRNVRRMYWDTFSPQPGFTFPIAFERNNFDSCAATVPSGTLVTSSGESRIESRFVDPAARNWALRTDSPLKGTGLSTPFLPAGNDLGPVQPGNVGGATTPAATPVPTTTTAVIPAPTTTANNPTTPAPTPVAYKLVFSTQADRSGPADLAGNSIQGQVAIFLTPESGVTGATFALGAYSHTEGLGPFDFAGGSAAAATLYDTAQVADGTRTIVTTLTLDGGRPQLTFVTEFQVSNAQGNPTTTTVVQGTPTTATVDQGNPTTTTSQNNQMVPTTMPCALPPLVGESPLVSCTRVCCDNANQGPKLEFRMSDEFALFDCPAWLSSVATRLRNPRICGFRRGSSIVEAQVDADIAQTAMANPAALGIRNLVSVTNTLSGQSATVAAPGSDTGLSTGVLVAIIIGAFMLLALILVLIIVLVRRLRASKSYRSSAAYVPLADSNIPMVHTVRAESGLVPCRLAHSTPDSGESVLSAQAGSIVFLDPADYADTGEWVWCKLGSGQQGYVPRLYLRPV